MPDRGRHGTRQEWSKGQANQMGAQPQLALASSQFSDYLGARLTGLIGSSISKKSSPGLEWAGLRAGSTILRHKGLALISRIIFSHGSSKLAILKDLIWWKLGPHNLGTKDSQSLEYKNGSRVGEQKFPPNSWSWEYSPGNVFPQELTKEASL